MSEDETNEKTMGDTEQSGPLMNHEQDPNDNEYATPPRIWRPLSRAVGGFDLDAASGAEPTPIAPDRYTADDNGLTKPWHGWVWLNPPWSSNGDGSAKKTWLRKVRSEVARETVEGVVVLLPADTSAHWFHDHALDAELICLVGPGRIPFIGESRNPSFAMSISVFGDALDALADVLNGLGAVIRGREVIETTRQATLPDGNERSTVAETERGDGE